MTDNTPNAGSRRQEMPFYSAIATNSFLPYVQFFSVSENQVRIPSLGAITVGKETNWDLNPTPQGAAAGPGLVPIDCEPYKCIVAIGDMLLKGIPGLGEKVRMQMFEAQMAHSGMVINDLITGASSGVKEETITVADVADSGKVVDALADMMAQTSAAQRTTGRPVFCVNPTIHSAIAKDSRNGGSAAYNAATGEYILHGHPVVLSDNVDVGVAANDFPAIFGNFNRGVALAMWSSNGISEYEQTKPGGIVFYSAEVYGVGILEGGALVRLKVVA